MTVNYKYNEQKQNLNEKKRNKQKKTHTLEYITKPNQWTSKTKTHWKAVTLQGESWFY